MEHQQLEVQLTDSELHQVSPGGVPQMTVATETATLKNYSQRQSLLISWFSGQANSGQQLRENRTALCDVMYYLYIYSYLQWFCHVSLCLVWSH